MNVFDRDARRGSSERSYNLLCWTFPTFSQILTRFIGNCKMTFRQTLIGSDWIRLHQFASGWIRLDQIGTRLDQMT